MYVHRLVSCNLLKQMTPSPVYPGLHVHSKLPTVLSHTAFISQLSVSRSHSSMSKVEKEYVTYIAYIFHIIQQCIKLYEII